MKALKFFKALKLGYKLLKAKNEKSNEPLFGKDPRNYGIKDLEDIEHARQTREVPTITKTFFPEDGGTFTEVIEGGNKYQFPFPGLPSAEVVQDIEKYKKMVPVAIDAYSGFFTQHKLRPERYCRSVREVYRLFTLMSSRECNKKNRDRWLRIRDMVCVVMEFDSAYRFRFQDMIKEAKIEELQLDPGDQFWAFKTKSYKWGHLTPEELKTCGKTDNNYSEGVMPGVDEI
jgi:hypothetical protein